MRIIINADDFGVNHTVNAAILDALELGCITSSTILANSSCLDEVKDIVNDFPNCSFGIHLNITEGQSLTNNDILYKYNLTDGAGFFNTHRCRQLEFEDIPKDLKDAVFQEWDTQIKRLLDQGFVISHIDGHHHCHTWYGLGEILIFLMAKYGIHRVRNKYISCPPNHKRDVIQFLSKTFLNVGVDFCSHRNNYHYKKLLSVDFYQSVLKFHDAIKGVKTTNCICAYEQFWDFYKESNRIIELMCHPGHPKMAKETESLMRDIYNFKANGNLISWNDV